MGKKVLIVILSVVLVCGAGTGIYFWQANASSGAPTPTNVSTIYSDVNSNESHLDSTIQSDHILSSEIESNSSTDLIINSYETDEINFTLVKCIDTTNNQKVTPREVLGEEFASSYIKLIPSENSIEINIIYNVKSGTYSIDKDNEQLLVVFDDDTSERYKIVFDDLEEISTIIIPFGDYNLYFG